MPVLDYRNGEFVFECSYEERLLPKNARFFFHRERRTWISSSCKCASRLLEYATQAARAAVVDKLGKFGSATTVARSDNRRFNHAKSYRYNI